MLSKNLKKRTIRHSIKFRIIVWYSTLTTVLAVIAAATVFGAGRTAQYERIKQNLIKDVERNTSAVEMQNGNLDIEPGFSFNSANTCTLIFDIDGQKIDGLYPEEIQDLNTPFQDGRVAEITIDKKLYYLYDRKINFNKLEVKIDAVTGEVLDIEGENAPSFTDFAGQTDVKGENCSITIGKAYECALRELSLKAEDSRLMAVQWYEYFGSPIYELEIYTDCTVYDAMWVRGVALTDDVKSIWNSVSTFLLWFLPLFILFAALSGIVISRRAMRPVEQFSKKISEINTASDLTKPVNIQASDRELQGLSSSFRAMFGRLKKSFEAEKQFSSDASHELRTPISVILSECELILDSENTDDETNKRVQSIRSQAVSMKELITKLLYSARLGQGKEHFSFTRENLSELVLQCTEDCALIHQGEVSIITHIEQDIYFDMDVSLITALVHNLLSNAVKYGKQQGTIRVDLSAEPGCITLRVSDDGRGIAPEDLEKIFFRFYRADKSRSDGNGSCGLGLAICEQIVTLHAGTISAQSVQGEGSTFTVTFPG